MKLLLNGKITDPENAVVPASISGVYYGAGCFETMRSCAGKFLRFDKHIDRFNRGLHWLGVPAGKNLEAKLIRDDISKLLETNELTSVDARVRIQAVLEETGGYHTSDKVPYSLVITAKPFTDVAENSIRLCSVSPRTIPGECRPAGLKLSNMLHYRQAFREAAEKGYDDGLMVNVNGYLAETSIANIFWRKGREIFTPSPQCDLLPGIMREIMIHILDDFDGYTVREVEFKPSVLRQASQVWLTNSVREIRWVKEIDQQEYQVDGEFRAALEKALQQYKKEYLV